MRPEAPADSVFFALSIGEGDGSSPGKTFPNIRGELIPAAGTSAGTVIGMIVGADTGSGGNCGVVAGVLTGTTAFSGSVALSAARIAGDEGPESPVEARSSGCFTRIGEDPVVSWPFRSADQALAI